jgi:hypothetical protein
MFMVDNIVALYYWGPYCGTLIIWIALVLLLRRRLKRLYLVLCLIVTPVLVIGVLHATYSPAVDLAAGLAVPHIQQALDAQCGVGSVRANAEGFSWSLDFGYRYESVDASCDFDYDSYTWSCLCHPRTGQTHQGK